MDDRERAMRRAAELGLEFLAGVGERHVGARTDAASLAGQLGVRNWSTTEADIDRTADAILRAAHT